VSDTTSHVLVVADGDEDSLEVSEVVSSPEMDITLICRVDEYEQSLYGGFLPTQGNLIAWLKQRLEVGLLPSEQVDGKILEFIRQGVLYKQLETSSRGKTLTTTRLRREHPLVEQALGSGSLDGEQSAGGDETQEYRHQMPRVVSARPWAPDTRG